MDDAALLDRVRRHASRRWVGVALFLLALPLMALSIYLVANGLAPGRRILLSVFCLGVSLATFGTNNDTALWAMAELQRRGKLVEPFVSELRHEATIRTERLRDAHASPKMAQAIPIVATLAIVGVLYLNLRDAGWLA